MFFFPLISFEQLFGCAQFNYCIRANESINFLLSFCWVIVLSCCRVADRIIERQFMRSSKFFQIDCCYLSKSSSFFRQSYGILCTHNLRRKKSIFKRSNFANMCLLWPKPLFLLKIDKNNSRKFFFIFFRVKPFYFDVNNGLSETFFFNCS